MAFNFSVPTPDGLKAFSVDPGTSLFFVGANGGGKSRLAVKIETDLGSGAHRIAAHRALSLNPLVPKLSSTLANKGLKFGIPFSDPAYGLDHREGSRWGSNAATGLLNDYDFLVQSLFAEQSNTALETHKNARSDSPQAAQKTKLEQLCEIWSRLLPHRKLDVSGDNIEVEIPGSGQKYSAADMSDGERSVFYLIGQVLMAEAGCLLIFDEPELHIHRSIVSRLWDELDAARPDCGMVLISHDLEFVASRVGQTFIIREYQPATGWNIEALPSDSGFSEELTTLILGSRKPVLFVEGRDSSLDRAIYRACYRDFTIVARNSCEEVIHAVVTMRANASLTRITCAGIVDADGFRSADDEVFLQAKGVAVLPVSEIENIFLIPDVLDEILKSEAFSGDDLDSKRRDLLEEAFMHASQPQNQQSTILRFCRRMIDQTLKKIDLSAATDAATLASEYAAKTSALDVSAIENSIRQNLQSAIAQKDVAALLRWYDNKNLLIIVAKAKSTRKDLFEQWLIRAMRNDAAPGLKAALAHHLPQITPA